jgi:thiamine pyrophosphokinase
MPAEERVEAAGIVVVVTGGPGADPVGALPLVRALPAGTPVVAADAGVDRALSLGLRVTVAVGDFDSVSSSGLRAAADAGARIERHAADKDATDLELALAAALALEPLPERMLVLGSIEGRLDHLLSALLLLGTDHFGRVEVDALLGPATVHVIRSGQGAGRRLEGSPGELISLFALHGPAQGVVTEGLRYPLMKETLEPGSSRGVSNVFAAPEAVVSLERGVLLGVRPGGEDEA